MLSWGKSHVKAHSVAGRTQFPTTVGQALVGVPVADGRRLPSVPCHVGISNMEGGFIKISKQEGSRVSLIV